MNKGFHLLRRQNVTDARSKMIGKADLDPESPDSPGNQRRQRRGNVVKSVAAHFASLYQNTDILTNSPDDGPSLYLEKKSGLVQLKNCNNLRITVLIDEKKSRFFPGSQKIYSVIEIKKFISISSKIYIWFQICCNIFKC